MGQIIRERERKVISWYEINFYAEGEICSGYQCDKDGNILKDKNTDCAYKNYLKDINNLNLKHYVKKWERHYTENALYRCDCGEEFELFDEYLGSCQCPKCGQWVNLFGQNLSNPETWRDGGDW